MSWTDIQDNEPGDSVRTKINNAFQALFGASPASLWEVIVGTGHVQPKESRPVDAGQVNADEVNAATVNAGSNGQVQLGNQMRLLYLAGFPELYKPLRIDAEGFVSADDSAGSQEASWGKASRYLWTGPASIDVDLQAPNIFVGHGVAQNLDISLPNPALSNTAEVYVTKMADNAYSVTLTGGVGTIRWKNELGGGLTTVDPGAYIRLKAVILSEFTSEWIVMEVSGIWTLIQ